METDRDITVKLNTNSLSAQAACPARYEIDSLVGQGGMGMVFRAFDSELSRQVAIKILFFEGANDKETQERFIREAQVLALLDHPNIVRIFSSGFNANGNPYHVMEYLEGKSLAQELQSGPLSSQKFYSVFSQVLSGLQHAHDSKIAHRDLKPSNIMLCKNPAGEDVSKIIDFGIARIEASPEQSSHTITRTDAVLGSPLYISPEQCRSARGDSLSDIYSIGCIMYECIEGKAPIQGETPFETMYKHMVEAPARLDTYTKSPRSIQLASLVARCLEKEPSARPKSAKEIANELAAIFQNDTVEIDLFNRRKSPSTPKGKIVKLAAISIFLLAICGIGVGLALKQSASTVKLETEQDRIARDLEKQKTRISRKWPENMVISEDMIAPYLNDLLTLGRYELMVGTPQECANAEKTYGRGFNFCQKYGDKLIDRQAAFLTMRANSKWKQGNCTGAQNDFDEVFELASKLEPDAEIKIDMYKERALFNLQKHDFDNAIKDVMSSTALYDKNEDSPKVKESVLISLNRIGHLPQAIDPQGPNRVLLMNAFATSLRQIKPKSEEEALKLVALSNHCAKRLAKHTMDKKRGAKEAAEYSVNLLKSVKGHAALKEETMNIYRSTKID